MVNKSWEKLLLLGFTINILTIFLWILQFIFIVSFPNKTMSFITNPNYKTWLYIVSYMLSIPTLLFWIYNVIFLFQHDRYSKSLFLLIFFSFIYAPIYFYQVKIKRRPLINELKPEPIINQTIHLEEYENESDFEMDLKNLLDDNQTNEIEK
jgi:hypothetical protein